MTHHPELSSRIHDLSDTLPYFDADDILLPPELWPGASAETCSEIMTNDDIRGPDGQATCQGGSPPTAAQRYRCP